MADRGRAATYNRPLVAALYDVDVRLTSRLLWGASVSDQADRLATLLQDGPVLDVPAGTGLVSAKAMARRPRASTLVAVDLSRAMLLRARRRLGNRAVYVEADAAHLPFRDGAFAAAHSANGFHLFPDRTAVAAELARTLRPGGTASIITWTNQGRTVARAYQRLLERLGHIDPPLPPADHQTTFERAGLTTDDAEVTGTVLRWTGHPTAS